MTPLARRSVKLFEGMSKSQRARLAFQMLGAGKEDEARRIFDSVEKQVYAMTDEEFMTPLQRAIEFGLVVGIAFWKMTNTVTAAHGLAIAEDGDKAALSHLAGAKRGQAAFLAAARAVAESRGIDWAGVLRVAGIDADELPPETDHDTALAMEFVTELQSMFD